MISAVLFAFQLQSTTISPRVVDGHGAPAVAVPRLADALSLDGRLDEPMWRDAVRLTGFSQYSPVDGRAAEERTEVLVFYGPKAIYFGIVAFAKDPSSIRAGVSDRDNIANDDRVTIYLDTFNDRRRAFFFAVNPFGVQSDGVRSESGMSAGMMFGGNIDNSPDYRFDSKGLVTDSGYVVEVRIPFKSLRFPSDDPQRWGINVVRYVRNSGYENTWTDAKRASSSFLGQSGMLTGIRDVERGVVVEAQPFVTSSLEGRRHTADRFVHDPPDHEAGLNLRLGFPALSLDATINPDFSQVESDAGLVTANERFALFFAEKRPFFLEGIELFGTPNQLVYTRQISNPAAGGKVTGKIGRFGIAHLTALDDTRGGPYDGRAPGDRYALFNVSRLRTDLGRGSVAGLTLTDRRQGNLSNTVAAADARLVFRKLYYAEAQLGAGWTRDPLGSVKTNAAPVWKLEADRTGRTWGFNYQLFGFDDEFQSATGFVPRTGIISASGFNRIAILGDRGDLIENFTFFAGPTRIWRYDDFLQRASLEGREELTTFATLRKGWSVSGTARRQFFALPSGAYASLRVRQPNGQLVQYQALDRLSGLFGGNLSVSTPVFRTFRANFSAARNQVALFSEGSEGRETRVGGGLALRPTVHIRAEANLAFSRLTRARDGSEFARTVIPRAKLEYQPTRAFFFRIVSEYRAERVAELRDALTGAVLYASNGTPSTRVERGSLRTDWLLSYEPTPGTVAFLGYGDTYRSMDPTTSSNLERTNDGFFLKLAYQFRR